MVDAKPDGALGRWPGRSAGGALFISALLCLAPSPKWKRRRNEVGVPDAGPLLKSLMHGLGWDALLGPSAVCHVRSDWGRRIVYCPRVL